jgi:hypothetical protein
MNGNNYTKLKKVKVGLTISQISKLASNSIEFKFASNKKIKEQAKNPNDKRVSKLKTKTNEK